MKDFLLNHAGKHPVSFHMPGHKGAALYKRFGHGDFLEDFLNFDITEIEGADNLFQREGIIRDLAEKYRRLYRVRASIPLINGTSCGLMAAILTTVPRGGKLILARNCHKSVFNAVTMGGIQPIYARPDLSSEWGISGAVAPEEIEGLLRAHPEASAVVLPSPNYYGICSDIQKIAAVVHRFGKILIVDQAHGAHLEFFHQLGELSEACPAEADSGGMKNFAFPLNAERAGADIAVNSIHKTLGSMTQSALLNLCSHRIDPERLEDWLQMLESTSPSYILMASLDINAGILQDHRDLLFREWKENLEWFYSQAREIPGLRIMETPGLDRTKLNLDLSGRGYTGRMLEVALIEEFEIYPELNTGNILMAMTGIGNTREDYGRLLEALRVLAERGKKPSFSKNSSDSGDPAMKDRIAGLLAQEDKTCIRSVIPYPPGIPLICPGETITKEQLHELTDCLRNGEKVLGLTKEGLIKVKEG